MRPEDDQQLSRDLNNLDPPPPVVSNNVAEIQEQVQQIEPPPRQRIQNIQQHQYQDHVAALAAIAEAEESFLGTIENLNHQNRRLEAKINEADAQNNLLQMQLKVLAQKMENLENFMLTLNSIQEDEDEDARQGESQKSASNKNNICSNCPKCGYNINTNNKKLNQAVLRRSESFDRELFSDMLPESMYNTKGRSGNEDQTNPMMIDLIVAQIMDFLPPKVLLKCRKVNRLWNDEACFRLKQCLDFKINFDNIDLISRFTENPSSSSFLFSRLKIELGFVVNPFRNYLEDFFKIYGPSITSFSLSCEEEFANRLYTEEFRTIFLAYLTNIEKLEFSLPTKITERNSIYEDVHPRSRFVFPNLKSLTFNQFDNSGGYGVWFTKEILKMAPNLQSLTVSTHNKEVITRILLALGDRECRVICSNLKHLYLDAYVTQQHLEMISQFTFQLVSLQLSYLTVEVRSETLEGLLGKQRSSLKVLIVGDYQKRPSQTSLPLVIRLPIMSKLNSIKLIDPLFPDQRNLIFSPLSYSVQLPKLRHLDFEHEAGRPAGVHLFSDLFSGPPSPCESLRELKISHGLSEHLLITQAAKMFPNLTRLDVGSMSDSVLREVFTLFPNVADFRLELCPANVNVDSLLTGIPYEVCKKIQERHMFSQVEALDVLDIIRTEPSLCNFTNLRSLKIEGLPSTLLTAVTGYLALSQMKTLTSVSIKSDVATISRECRRILGERLNLTLFELF